MLIWLFQVATSCCGVGFDDPQRHIVLLKQPNKLKATSPIQVRRTSAILGGSDSGGVMLNYQRLAEITA
jgi:hypothetical protein